MKKSSLHSLVHLTTEKEKPVNIFRLIYGQKLENEIKCNDSLGLSEEDFVDSMIRFIEKWDFLRENNTPFIVFIHRDGKGWSPIDYNKSGWEMYAESIMGEQ